MERKPVPRFNQDIDGELIIFILKKNIVWILGVLLVLLFIYYLYIRYTIPHYQSSTVIQLTEENSGFNFLDDKNRGNTNIAQDIELLRSQVFIQRVIDSLPLGITYFNEGRILDFDNYTLAPYHVDFIELTPEIYDVPIYIKFTSASSYILKYKIGRQKFEHTLNTNLPQKSPHFNIQVTVIDTASCLQSSNPYYFTFNKISNLLSQFSSKLQVQVQNAAARTILIIFTDVNPARASDFANRVAKEFANFNLEKKSEGVDNVIAYMDKTLNLVKINLNEADSSLISFKQKNNIVDEKNSRDPILDKNLKLVELLENQKLDYDIQLLGLNDVIKNITKENLDIYEILTQISQLKAEGYLMGTVNTINLLITKRDQLLENLTENSKKVIEVKQKIEIQRKLLIKSLETIKTSTQSKITELEASINKIQSELFIGSGNLPNQAEFIQKKRVFEVNQTYYDLLIQKRVEYDLLSKGYTSGYRVLQYSIPAKTPIYPRKLFILMIVIGLWLIITFIIFTLIYLYYDKVHSVEQITKYCDVAVLASVHKYKDDIPVSQLVVDISPKSLIAESFRNIRTNLDFISNKPGPKLIAITSTISGEGKTFIAINLAGILAFTGKKVILIDADMRKPKIHSGFSVSNEKGLSNLLIGKNTLEECIRSSSLENLYFITAGPIPPNPSELLLSTEMTLLIESLKKEYDYILVDNPPIGIVTDSMPILQKADYPIYVFRSGISRKFYINTLQKIKYDNKINNISIVLNGITHKQSDYYGYGNYTSATGYGYYVDEAKTKKRIFFFWKK